MTTTAFASGTLTTTGSGTEDFLTSPNAAGVYQLVIDTNDMVDGDVIEVRIYQMTLTGGTQRVLYFQAYYGAQATDDKIKNSIPVANELTDTNSLRFSIKQTFGTVGISIPWKVLKFA